MTARVRKNLCYRGKVNYIEGQTVGVTLFSKRDIYGEFEKAQFPRQRLKVGDIFDYNYTPKSGVNITMVRKKRLTDAQIEEMRKDLEARLPKDLDV